MTKLIVTKGLPGSGKTSWAREEAARTGAALVSRDDIRGMWDRYLAQAAREVQP